MIGLLIGMALATAPPAPDEEAAVLATAEQLLGRLTGKDPAAMAALTLPEGGATATVTGADGKTAVRHFTWPDFFAHLPKDKPIVEEHLRDHLVRVDGDVAMVWGRYEVTLDGKFLHCGTDHFDLVRVAGRWRILNVTWNQRTEGCGR
jgi:putative lumazine-binding protein